MATRWAFRVAIVLATAGVAGVHPHAQNSYSDIEITLPSTVGGAEGLAVRVATPASPRYPDGAPVAIFVAGGGRADAYEIRSHLTEGALEITFAFPSGELDGRFSGGTYDQRGPGSQRALADVVNFALGRSTTTDGRRLRDLVSFPVLTSNVGLVGWSRGGDSVVNTLARYPEQTTGVAWAVIHESPLFDSAMTGEIAHQAGKPAAAADYVAGTCALVACQMLYPSIRWDSARDGTLYLDRSGNGRYDSAIEVALPSSGGSTGTRYYTLGATQAAAAAGAFGSSWPATVATSEQAAEYWSVRDARYQMAALVASHPSLAVITHATSVDHVQTAEDHPHVALAYNALRLGGARWVRMNPDRAHTQSIGSGFPDNEANAALPSDFSSWLMPEESTNDPLVINAAILELTDRVHNNDWSPNLALSFTSLSRQSSAGLARATADATSSELRRDKPAGATGSAGLALTGAGYITFVINIHDWKHLDESAATLLRAIGVFEKYRVRGDFYLTGPMAELYMQRRPDVIERLRESGMTISYHVRAPHPLYAGFDAGLEAMATAEREQTLMEYETYSMDLATGSLDRSKPGGYQLVTSLFGSPAVTIVTPSDSTRVADSARRVYESLGAKMCLVYHESGTDPDEPLEYKGNLLIRPSDFSITRWSVNGGGELFWWNMLGSRSAAQYEPATYLQQRLASWSASRPAIVTALIHENNFVRSGAEGWTLSYYTDTTRDVPLSPPFDVNAADPSALRSESDQERIWTAYENLVAWASANLTVVTSADLVALARQ